MHPLVLCGRYAIHLGHTASVLLYIFPTSFLGEEFDCARFNMPLVAKGEQEASLNFECSRFDGFRPAETQQHKCDTSSSEK